MEGPRVRGLFWLVVPVLLCAGVFAPQQAGANELTSFRLPSPLVDTATPGGRIADGRTTPKVNVLLPDGYNRKSRRGYPVLYLLHGANGSTENWIPGVKDSYKGFPGIIVMPDGGKFGMYVNWWNDGVRGGPAWADYHLRVLRNAVTKRYPIRTKRRWHAIGGISMGGQGALRYSAMLPGYFGSVIGLSPAVPDMQSADAQLGVNVLPLAGGGEGVSYETVFGPPDGPWAEGNSPQALAGNYGHTRIYVTAGDGVNCPGDPKTATYSLDVITETAIHRQMKPFAVATRALGARVTNVPTCGVHTFGVWDRATIAARKWGFFRPVAEHPANWTYRTIATKGEMWGLRFSFRTPPQVAATFKRSGQRLSGSGKGRVLIKAGRKCQMNLKLPFKRRLPKHCPR